MADAPRYTGNLVIEDWSQGGVFGRCAAGVITRHDHLQAPRDLLVPLFEPQLMRMPNTQMTLPGYHIHAETGTAVHYAQCWALRQVETLNS